MALPVFVFGAVLILFFAIKVHWFPAGGYVNPSKDLWGAIMSLTLPSISLAVGFGSQITSNDALGDSGSPGSRLGSNGNIDRPRTV